MTLSAPAREIIRRLCLWFGWPRCARCGKLDRCFYEGHCFDCTLAGLRLCAEAGHSWAREIVEAYDAPQ